MKKAILVTRPRYDDATEYLFCYAKKAIDFANEKNVEVLDLTRPRLTQKNFSDLISKKDPLLIFFNAHGDENTIYGDKINGKEEILIREDKNHNLLNKRIVYARACLSSASLGQKACKDGCFIGYRMPFSFWVDNRWSAKPLNDNTAKLFLEPSNLIIISLLKGNSAKEAHEKSLKMTSKNILELLKNKDEPGAMASIMLLWNNMQCQEILGNEDMTLDTL